MILAGDYIPKGCRVDWRLPSGTVLCNLEAPVLGDAPERFRPSPKAGPSLYNVTLGNERREFAFNLANNHMMDYGPEGMRATPGDALGAGNPLLRRGGDAGGGANADVSSGIRPGNCGDRML